MDNRKVTRIEPLDKLPEIQKIVLHKKVAAYVRVSTESDEQLGSFVAQTDYYYKYIAANPNWEFAGIYSDEGISGTNTKAREGFNNMIADALDGKIDLIITKSLSRFARNTVDALKTIRALKEKNIEVYFEKEDIYTLDSKGELLITLMSSLAQEESRNLSENVTWGRRKRFADGEYKIIYSNFLGYKEGKNGSPEIDEDEARIIRYIFLRFLEGWTAGDIERKLENAKITTARNKENWRSAVIKNILSNEKYYGAALLQKKYTADYLTKKMVKNNGVLPQYFVENGHPAIISKEIFDEAQKKIEFVVRPISKETCFNEKLFCEVCDKIYGRKKWTRADGVYTYVWECSQKYNKDIPKCNTPHIYEEFLMEAYSQLIEHLFKIYNDIIIKYLRSLCDIIDAKILLEKFNTFIDFHSTSELYDKNTWLIMVQKAVVTKDKRIVFETISGETFTYYIPDKRRPSDVTLHRQQPYKKKEKSEKQDKPKDTTAPKKKDKQKKATTSKKKEEPILGIMDGYCHQCGAKIEPYSYASRQRFCSEDCKAKWFEAQGDKPRYMHICNYCGRMFEVFGKSGQKYCSQKCLEEASKKNDDTTEDIDEALKPRGFSVEDKKLIAFYTRQGYGYRRIAKLTDFNICGLKTLLYRHHTDPFYYPPSDACKHCGKPITQTPHKREKKFCSDECRMAWWRVNNKAINKKAFYEFVCQQCGQTFEAYGNKNRMYCSRKCYAEARKKKPQEE